MPSHNPLLGHTKCVTTHGENAETVVMHRLRDNGCLCLREDDPLLLPAYDASGCGHPSFFQRYTICARLPKRSNCRFAAARLSRLRFAGPFGLGRRRCLRTMDTGWGMGTAGAELRMRGEDVSDEMGVMRGIAAGGWV